MSAVSYVSKVRDSVREKVNKWHSTKLDPGFNEDLKGPNISRRQALGIVASSVTTGAAGCQDIMGGDDPKTTVQPTDEPTETPESTATPEPTQTPSEIERLESKNEELRELKDKLEDDGEGEKYEQVTETLIGEDGYAENDKETVRYLNQMREDLSQDAFDTTTSTIAKLEEFEDTHWKTIETWMESDLNEFNGFRKEAFETGFTDTDEDGVAEGLAEYIGMNEGEEYDKLAPVVQTLAENVKEGFDDLDVKYLERLRKLADADFDLKEDNLYVDNSSNLSYWYQAEALGLLEEKAETGEIEQETLTKLRGVKKDILLRGAKARLGLVDERAIKDGKYEIEADTTGDGMSDGIQVVMSRSYDIGFDPNSRNLPVQVDTAGNVDENELQQILDRINEAFPGVLQWDRTNQEIGSVDSIKAMRQKRAESFTNMEKGQMYMMIQQQNFESNNGILIDFAADYDAIRNGDPISTFVAMRPKFGEEWAPYWATMQSGVIHGAVDPEFRNNDPEEDKGIYNENIDPEIHDDWEISEEVEKIMADRGFFAGHRNYEDIMLKLGNGVEMDDPNANPYRELFGAYESSEGPKAKVETKSVDNETEAISSSRDPIFGDVENHDAEYKDPLNASEKREEIDPENWEDGDLIQKDAERLEGTPYELGFLVDGTETKTMVYQPSNNQSTAV
jgi:hypothetical protein